MISPDRRKVQGVGPGRIREIDTMTLWIRPNALKWAD